MAEQLRLAQSGWDVYEIFNALLLMLRKSPAPQMALVEEEVAYRNLKQAVAEQRLYVYGDFAILVDAGSPWHTSKKVLIEEIVIRWRREFNTPVEAAIRQLDRIAKEHGCVAIAAGDTQVGIMGPRYTAAGFKTLGTQFFKEVP